MMCSRPFALVFVITTAFSACSTQVEEAASADFAPILSFAPETDDNRLPTGAIYLPQNDSLFAIDRRASRVGDILTVSFAESFQATKSQNAGTAKTSSFDVTLPNISPLPSGADLSHGTTQNFSGSGTAAQSNSLTGQVSVHVVRVMPGGNLEILGQKKLTLNNGDEYVRLHGIVRPNDILANNIVMSDRVANAEITYIGAGDLADAGRRGWLSRFISSLSPN